jgi:A/G-specific adenine glycosylase
VNSLHSFSARLLKWFDHHGRHDLPWQEPRSPYRVWLAEVMLQQTQVATVIPYFKRFLARCPNLASLAAAPTDEVLRLWAGLGYYARARNLHRAAQLIVKEHGGEFPVAVDAVAALPGIGRSTAGAILAQAFGQRHAILDGNVRRVLARHGAVAGWTGAPAVQKQLWTLSERHLPHTRLADYTQAIMDLGATLCTAHAPACGRCPVHEDCLAFQQGRVGEIPAPRPRRERPLRRAHILIIANAEGELLLLRRPPTGIWGGLWSPPVLDQEDDWQTHCRDHLGIEVLEHESLPVLRHSFTHFELELAPLWLSARPVMAIAEPSSSAWTNMSALPSLGLPAPVKKLLKSFAFAHENPPCPAPSTASNLESKPKALSVRHIRARSASASSSKPPSGPGRTGSRTRRA